MNITFYQPQVLISLAFLFLLLGVLLVKLIKPLNKLLEYGKNTEVINESPTSSIVNFITGNLVVPKQWFTHFYICLFTLATASYFKACHEKIIGQSSLPSVTFKNISIIHKLLWIQGGRRMVESFAVTKFSSESKINFSHYVVGMAHYTFLSMLFQAHSTASQKTECPISIFLESTSFSVVYGCPGIPRSIPRIETVAHIRSNDGSPFMIRSAAVYLITRQKVSVPAKFGSNEAFKEIKSFEDPLAFKPANDFSQKVLGVDLPILIPIPRDIAPSNFSLTFGACTTHYLVVKVTLGENSFKESSFLETFPVVIKTYDTLPLYRQFNEPVVESRKSPDNQVVAEITVSVTAIGPGDKLSLKCKLSTNAANNKVKKNITVKQITCQVKECLECHDGGLPPLKENKLHTATLSPGRELNTQGEEERFEIPFPQTNDYLQIYQFQEPSIIEQEVSIEHGTTIIESTTISSNKLSEKLHEGLSITHNQSLTLQGHFYSIRFELILKLKFSRAKDFDVRLPIIVCPFDRKSSEYLLKWIMHECEVAKARFGKHFVDQFFASKKYADICSLMNRYRTAPTVYRFCKDDWEKLGYNGASFNNPKSISLTSYID
ncbi:hypothetical protein KGF56_004010 [Candida oxycetoniae]|uniref:Arrestin C-terminal-like domain-containing protein n=1 Tax=Candida oxycetoniae TaxID=497107 RepID=A0AAI9SU50_9ASCO|nr:uncharacterized protein KGF56_004010 [Candida oxycetoniae]KAI3403121.2 hypothetical protein KGF56_004010 [Candida oxycetoniae]